MHGRFDFNERGLRVFSSRLYNHDYLWFSSFEIAKIAGTTPVVHNYALSYAISHYSHGIHFGGGPQYEADLEAMQAYATPAFPVGAISLTRLTQNAINSVSLRTDDAPRGVNSPAIGYRLVLDPVWQVIPGAADPSGFTFYTFVKANYRLPSVVRLAKKGCPVRLWNEEISAPVATFCETIVRPTHGVNPLDVTGDIIAYQPIPLPPYLVLKSAEIRNDWFIFSGQHRVHVPARFTAPDSAAIPSRRVPIA